MTIPRNILQADECGIIRLKCSGLSDAFLSWLLGTQIEYVSPNESSDPNWACEEVRRFIDDHRRRQILLVGDIEDHALLIIALLCVERGYHLFILCPSADLRSPDVVNTRMRLINSGATFVTLPQVQEELTLTMSKRQNLTEATEPDS